MSLNNNFGDALRRVLTARNMSQVELSILIDKSKATVNSYLKVKSPHKPSLDIILTALNLTEEEFYTIGTGKIEERQAEYIAEPELKGRLSEVLERLAAKEKENEELKSKLIELLEKENKVLQEANSQG